MMPALVAAIASDGSLTIDAGTPASSDFWSGPQRYGAAAIFGTMVAVDAADTRVEGLRYTSDGVLRLYDATDALPSGTTTLGGVAITSDGQLCVTHDAVASATFVGAMAVRNDGAVFVGARGGADAVIAALSPAAWFRNATNVTAAGGLASAWGDYSGNARNLAQATGTNQPAYDAGIFTFDGADNYMKTAAFTLEQPTTLIMVVRQDAWTLNEVLCDGNGAAGGAIQQATTTPKLTLNAGTQTAENAGITIGEFGIVAAVFNGASSSLKVNLEAETTGNANTGDMGGVTLGATGTPSNYGACSFKEFIAFPSALSEANRIAVITALNNALGVF